MRLKKVENGQNLWHRIRLRTMRALIGQVPDVMRMMWYRPSFFGAHFMAASQQALRGPSDWSVGERELFGAFVSRLNQCPF